LVSGYSCTKQQTRHKLILTEKIKSNRDYYLKLVALDLCPSHVPEKSGINKEGTNRM